jgi:hypothetical protein
MKLLVLYSIGWVIALFKMAQIIRAKDMQMRTFDKAFLWIVFCIPMGKLVFFNVPGLMGFKFSFLAWSIFVLLLVFISPDSIKIHWSELLLFTALVLFPVISLFSRLELGGLFYYSGDGQRDSILARLVSYMLFIAFSFYTSYFIRNYGFEELFRHFLEGVFCASIVGVVFFVMVYYGYLTVNDLRPISADTHIVFLHKGGDVMVKMYRFNPGGNVDEFGALSACALFMSMALSGLYKKSFSYFMNLIFFFALVFSLTRAAWLAYLAGIAALFFLVPEKRKQIFISFCLLILVVFIVSVYSESVGSIVQQRTAIALGPGGEERIVKYLSAWNTLTGNWWNILFGMGWATNLYMHSVPLQLFYETGVVGTLFFAIIGSIIAFLLLQQWAKVPEKLKIILAGIVPVLLVISLLNHTLYLMQTWFVMGVVFSQIFYDKNSVDSYNVSSECMPGCR